MMLFLYSDTAPKDLSENVVKCHIFSLKPILDLDSTIKVIIKHTYVYKLSNWKEVTNKKPISPYFFRVKVLSNEP